MSSRGRSSSGRCGGRGTAGGRGGGMQASTVHVIPTPPMQPDTQHTQVSQSEEDTPQGSPHVSYVDSASIDAISVYHTGGNEFDFSDSNVTSLTISSNLKSHITQFWPKFTSVPFEVKDAWFEEFKDQFTWAPDTSFAMVRHVWNTKCSKCYRCIVSEMKKKKRKHGCISIEVWNQFKMHWEQEDVKQRAAQNSANRLTNPKVYAGGSRSTAQYKNDLLVEYRREPTFMEVYKRMRYITPSDGSESRWIDQSSAAFAGKYEAKVAELCDEGKEITQEEEDRIFEEIVSSEETRSSRRQTRRPGFGNIPAQYRNNTFSTKCVESNERQKLNEELKAKDEEISTLKVKVSGLETSMTDVMEFMLEYRKQRSEDDSGPSNDM